MTNWIGKNPEVKKLETVDELNSLAWVKEKLDELRTAVETSSKETPEKAKELQKEAYQSFIKNFSPEKQRDGGYMIIIEENGKQEYYLVSWKLLKEQVASLNLLNGELDIVLQQQGLENSIVLADIAKQAESVAPVGDGQTGEVKPEQPGAWQSATGQSDASAQASWQSTGDQKPAQQNTQQAASTQAATWAVVAAWATGTTPEKKDDTEWTKIDTPASSEQAKEKPEKKTNTSEDIEKMTEEERQLAIKETVALIMADGLKVERITGRWVPYSINVTERQLASFQKLGRLWYLKGAAFAAQDGTIKETRTDKRIYDYTIKAQDALNRWDIKEATGLVERVKKMTEKRKKEAAKLAKLSTDLANDLERMQYNLWIAGFGLEAARQAKVDGYHGQTFSIDQYHPTFVNICRNLCEPENNGAFIIELGNGDKAIIESREVTERVNWNADNTLRRNSPDIYKDCPEYRDDWISKLLMDNTKMSPEQARKNAKLLKTWGIAAWLFFLGRWLFTGKWIDGKEHKAWWFLGRLGIAAGGLLGLNMLSQGATGKNGKDLLRWLWYGDIKFNDLFNGRIGKEKVPWTRFSLANSVLRDVPVEVIYESSTEASDGSVKINLATLDGFVAEHLNKPWLSQDDREFREQKREAIKSFKDEPDGEAKLAAILAEMGVTYEYIKDPKKKKWTLNGLLDLPERRQSQMTDHLEEHNLTYAMEDPDKDPDISSYLATGKPSLEELKKKNKFKAIDVADSLKDLEITDAWLKQIEAEEAKIYQNALNSIHNTVEYKNASDRPTFEYKNGTLYLKSYGLDTPIFRTANWYEVGGLGVQFTSPEHAIKTASLINFLILTNNGAWETDQPFDIVNGDLKIGNAKNLTWRNWLDKTKLAQSAQRYFGTTQAADGADWSMIPWNKSSLKEIGWANLDSVAWLEKLKIYLNNMRSAKWSIWNKNTGWVMQTSEIVNYTVVGMATAAAVNVASGGSNPETPATGSTNRPTNAPTNSPSQAPENTDSSWEKMKDWTKEKREWFKRAVDKTTDSLGAFFAGVFSGEAFRPPLSTDVQRFKDELDMYKKNLEEIEKMEHFKRESVATVLEMEELRVKLEENEKKLQEIQELASEKIDDELVGVANLEEQQQKDLTLSRKKINFEKKFKEKWDILTFYTSENKKELYVNSFGKDTQIRYEKGKWYFLVWLNVPFTNPDDILRIANLTNFLKVNFYASSSAKVDSAWKAERGWDLKFFDKNYWAQFKSWNIFGLDTSAVDGEDYIGSTLKKIGGTTFQSQVENYAKYLNSVKDVDGNNYWVKKEYSPEQRDQLVEMKVKIEQLLVGWVLTTDQKNYPKLPSWYAGDRSFISKTAVEINSGVVELASHNHKICIVPQPDGKYKIWYQNAIQQWDQMVNNLLDISFPTLEEAIKMANLVNFYRKAYYGNGIDRLFSDPFQVTSSWNLIFNNGKALWAVSSRALWKKEAADYSLQELTNKRNMNIFKNWLNSMKIWTRKA